MTDDMDETNPGRRPPPVLTPAEFSVLMKQILAEHDEKMDRRLAKIEAALETIANQLLKMSEDRRVGEQRMARLEDRVSALELWKKEREGV